MAPCCVCNTAPPWRAHSGVIKAALRSSSGFRNGSRSDAAAGKLISTFARSSSPSFIFIAPSAISVNCPDLTASTYSHGSLSNVGTLVILLGKLFFFFFSPADEITPPASSAWRRGFLLWSAVTLRSSLYSPRAAADCVGIPAAQSVPVTSEVAASHVTHH